jgi:hypothetical protein
VAGPTATRGHGAPRSATAKWGKKWGRDGGGTHGKACLVEVEGGGSARIRRAPVLPDNRPFRLLPHLEFPGPTSPAGALRALPGNDRHRGSLGYGHGGTRRRDGNGGNDGNDWCRGDGRRSRRDRNGRRQRRRGATRARAAGSAIPAPATGCRPAGDQARSRAAVRVTSRPRPRVRAAACWP